MLFRPLFTVTFELQKTPHTHNTSTNTNNADVNNGEAGNIDSDDGWDYPEVNARSSDDEGVIVTIRFSTTTAATATAAVTTQK